MMGCSRLSLSLPVSPSDWHPISVYPRLTLLSDLSAHKLHRPPDARAVRDIHQKRLESGGGRRCQICRTFLRETGGDDMEASPVQLAGQQITETAVAARDEDMLLVEGLHH